MRHTSTAAREIPVLSTSDSLAVTRTFLAHERTSLAWIRTAIGLIGFGLTFYKFFEYLTEHGKTLEPHRWLGPRGWALILILVGIITLVLAGLGNLKIMRQFRLSYSTTLPRSHAPVLAFLVAAFGLFSLVVTYLRL